MLEEAFALATQTQKNAHCPYSKYSVGAAIGFRANGERHLIGGCNVEKISFGLCQCAERSAICTAVALFGKIEIDLVVVATKDGGTPCGACRQVISEFAAENCKVICVDETGNQNEYDFASIFPNSFHSDQLG